VRACVRACVRHWQDSSGRIQFIIIEHQHLALTESWPWFKLFDVFIYRSERHLLLLFTRWPYNALLPNRYWLLW